MNETAFLEEIAKKRAHNLTRLVYADWCDENGKPNRAATLRAEVAAAKIIGWKRVLGILDVERHYGAYYDEQDLRVFTETPFPPDVLTRHKRSHILVAGYSLTLADILPSITAIVETRIPLG